jgi:hypothetical protein
MALVRSLSTSIVPTIRPSIATGKIAPAHVEPNAVRYRGSAVTSCTTTGFRVATAAPLSPCVTRKRGYAGRIGPRPRDRDHFLTCHVIETNPPVGSSSLDDPRHFESLLTATCRRAGENLQSIEDVHHTHTSWHPRRPVMALRTSAVAVRGRRLVQRLGCDATQYCA